MKKNLTLLIVLASFTTFAQSPLHSVVVGDTIELRVTGAHASIQWQQSTDSLTWTDITGLTDSIEVFLATSSPTNKRFYKAKITDAQCPLTPGPWYSSVIRHKIITSATQVAVGDWFYGGIVFYTDGTGHGLIAPQQYQSTGVEWGCYGTSIPGATSLTDGASNTTAIVAACTTTPIAASICNDLTLNGYNDWFLPAKDQLNYLYQQRSLVGGFSNYLYLSSSEANASLAWGQSFDDGYQSYANKLASPGVVRCVRSF
ncbi:MAG: DUF1566 domain-containing protein [Bacteroidia bacterium]|nr:DUF1566 domain-containing protein [Bacteroidia bacterium]